MKRRPTIPCSYHRGQLDAPAWQTSLNRTRTFYPPFNHWILKVEDNESQKERRRMSRKRMCALSTYLKELWLQVSNSYLWIVVFTRGSCKQQEFFPEGAINQSLFQYMPFYKQSAHKLPERIHPLKMADQKSTFRKNSEITLSERRWNRRLKTSRNQKWGTTVQAKPSKPYNTVAIKHNFY